MYYDFFTQRQIGRRELVGSTDITQPIIESSYERLLDLMTAGFAERDFFLGDRPGRRLRHLRTADTAGEVGSDLGPDCGAASPEGDQLG